MLRHGCTASQRRAGKDVPLAQALTPAFGHPSPTRGEGIAWGIRDEVLAARSGGRGGGQGKPRPYGDATIAG